MALGFTAHAEAETPVPSLFSRAQHLCFSHQATLLPTFLPNKKHLRMVTVDGSLDFYTSQKLSKYTLGTSELLR